MLGKDIGWGDVGVQCNGDIDLTLAVVTLTFKIFKIWAIFQKP